MEPPHNKLITGRTSFAKGTCPERNEGGQAHKSSRQRKRTQKFKKGAWQDFPRFARDKLTTVLSMTGIKNLKGDPKGPLLKFWLPE